MIYLLYVLLLWIDAPEAHDFHVSRCEIVYRSESRSLEITMHMFADDVELALREDHPDPIHLGTELEIDGADAMLNDYILNHLQISITGKEAALSVLGKEPGESNEAIWVYVEGTDVDLGSDMTIAYDLLLDVYSDQKNIVSFQRDNDQRKMFLLDRSEPSITFASK